MQYLAALHAAFLAIQETRVRPFGPPEGRGLTLARRNVFFFFFAYVPDGRGRWYDPPRHFDPNKDRETKQKPACCAARVLQNDT